jgi:hypothetical protein
VTSKLGVLTAIAEGDAYDRGQAEEIRADLIARGALVPDQDAARQVRADEPSAEEPSGTAEVVETGDERELARQEIASRAAAGLPELSGKALGRMFGRSERWGRDRIAEVRRSTPAASPVAVAASPVQDAAESAANGAHVPALGSAAATPDTGTGGSPAPSVALAADDTALPGVDELPVTATETAGVAAPRPSGKPPRAWPVLLLALPAFVAIWGGWVGLGEMSGFGPVRLLPGIADDFVINSAITLPIGVEAYAAYALRVWLSGLAPTERARRFAQWSAIGSLVLGMAGQVAYHLMEAAGMTVAPWQITTFVSCLPVVVLGCGAALAHLLHNHGRN